MRNDTFMVGDSIYPYTDIGWNLKVQKWDMDIPEYVKELCCSEFECRNSDFSSRTRRRHMVYARDWFHFLMHTLSEREVISKISLQKIGDYTNKDHATVLHSIRKVKHFCETYPAESRRRSKLWSLIIYQTNGKNGVC